MLSSSRPLRRGPALGVVAAAVVALAPAASADPDTDLSPSEISDPLERQNRAVFGFNESLSYGREGGGRRGRKGSGK